jgi:long-chain acyl-CoA synthetase
MRTQMPTQMPTLSNSEETNQKIAAAQCSTNVASRYVVDWSSLGALLAARARDQGGQVFIRFFDDYTGVREQWTYAAFEQLVGRIAVRLQREFGIGRGDAVATLAYNHPLAAAALFACWRIGAIAAPQNLHETDERIAFTLQDAACRVLLALPDSMERAAAISLSCGQAITVAVLDDATAHVPIPLPTTDDYRDDAALIVYTSGTTGNPKGVVLTQHNLMANALGTAEMHQIDSATVLMCVLPIHHVNGIVVTLVTTMLAGARVVLNRGFKAGTFWPRMIAENVSIVSVVPTILQFLCESAQPFRRHELPHIRHVICGAGTLAVALVEKFERQFQVPVIHGYGLSETTAFACSIPPQLPEKARQDWHSTFGYPSIGVALPHCEMAIHDAHGNALDEESRGEIVIRGPYVMSGYHHRPDANAETFKYQWFRSGDEGFFKRDENGVAYFFITGRLKELINRGGVKYSPFEIEEALLAIEGVKAALAIAFDNDWYGEEVGAYVVLDDGASLTEAEILERVRKKLPFAKAPKAVKFGLDIPVTTTGKYQRLKLKDLFAEYRATQFR